jgi:hypothetical protein
MYTMQTKDSDYRFIVCSPCLLYNEATGIYPQRYQLSCIGINAALGRFGPAPDKMKKLYNTYKSYLTGKRIMRYQSNYHKVAALSGNPEINLYEVTSNYHTAIVKPPPIYVILSSIRIYLAEESEDEHSYSVTDYMNNDVLAEYRKL